MAKFPIGKGTRDKGTGNAGTGNGEQAGKINLDALKKKARYIVDESGRRQSVVVDYAAWQAFLRQMGDSNAVGSPTNSEPEYALHPDRANGDLYRPQPARGKEAAAFTLETNVTRREG